jgi:transposase
MSFLSETTIWLEEWLMSRLNKPNIVIMDNTPFYKKEEIATILEKHGHAFLAPSPYFPDFNPIEIL